MVDSKKAPIDRVALDLHQQGNEKSLEALQRLAEQLQAAREVIAGEISIINPCRDSSYKKLVVFCGKEAASLLNSFWVAHVNGVEDLFAIEKDGERLDLQIVQKSLDFAIYPEGVAIQFRDIPRLGFSVSVSAIDLAESNSSKLVIPSEGMTLMNRRGITRRFAQGSGKGEFFRFMRRSGFSTSLISTGLAESETAWVQAGMERIERIMELTTSILTTATEHSATLRGYALSILRLIEGHELDGAPEGIESCQDEIIRDALSKVSRNCKDLQPQVTEARKAIKRWAKE